VRRALVTGATGLVGSYIVERLLADGWSVRALVRSPSPELKTLGVELVTGDVLDAASFANAAAGCEVVFHTAAAVIAAGGWDTYRRLNVDGTWNVIVAAECADARLLHLSSVAVYSSRYEDHSKKTHEDAPMGPLPERAFYGRSKRESELMVLQAHATGRIWATAVRPCVIYGRRDRHFVPRMANLLGRGFAPLIGGGRSTMALVHAANVADGAVLAATSDVAGGRAYNLANDFDVTVRECFLLGAEGLGKRVRLVPVPLFAARAAFAVLYHGLRLLSGGRASFLTRESLAMITRDNPYDSSRARRELGWTPRVRHVDGIPDAFHWWRDSQLHSRQ
jgi:nucleoside-diphosphate-sugar epimerase